MPYKSKETKLSWQKAKRLKTLEDPAEMKTRKLKTRCQMKTRNEVPTASDQLASISSVFSTPKGRQKLNNIFQSFKESSHPEYMKDVRLGVFGHTLDYIYKLSS